MFRLSQRMFFYILVAVVALIIAPHPNPSLAQTKGVACAATPNALGGQGFTLSGQGFTLSGQGFTLSGQGFTLSGQGFTLSGQGIDPEQVAQDILNNLITPDWFANFFPALASGNNYNSELSALVIIDDQEHGAQVMGALNTLILDPRIAPYMSNIELHFVDIGTPSINYEADAIAAAIAIKVNELQARDIKHIVLNMSFGFIPCEDTNSGFVFDDFLKEQQLQQSPPTPQGVEPILECVYKVSHHLWMARFGYLNHNGETVYINVGHKNTLSSPLKNLLLPNLFEAGRQEDVFEIPFYGGYLVWSLKGPDGIKRTAVASTYSTKCDDGEDYPSGEYETSGGGYYCKNREVQHPEGASLAEEFGKDYTYLIAWHCGDFTGHKIGWGLIRQALEALMGSPVIPILECVAYDADTDTYTAQYGYNNPNSHTVYIPIGFKNNFNTMFYAGQATYFMPGVHTNVFEVEFSEHSIVWELRHEESVPTSGDSPACIEDIGYSIEDYFRDVLGLSDEEIMALLKHLIMDVESETDLSALRNLLHQYLVDNYNSNNTQTVFTVASSGNYRPWLEPNPIPLVPARWYETIAAGATLGNNGPLWQFSQESNVRAPGAGYQIGAELIVSGTSFSAPGLSLALAQYGTYPAACITQEIGGTIYPPLVNVALTNSPLTVDETNPLTCYINFPPVAEDDAYTVDQGETLIVEAPGVLGNDSDPDDDPLTASLVTPPLYGTLTLLPSGGFSYMHNGGDELTDTFVYEASDGNASDTATVTITIEPIDVTPEPEPSAVVSLTLINADTDQPVEGYDPIPYDGELLIIDLDVIGTDNLTIRANVEGEPRSVVFGVNENGTFRIENVAPYALVGDNNGDYAAWNFELNVDYLVRATPYSDRDGKGNPGSASQVLIRFVREIDVTQEVTQEVTPEVTETATPEVTPEVTETVTPKPPADIAVVSFTLINADTDQPVPGYDPLPANTVIDVSVLGTQFNIRANTTGDVGSVVFSRNEQAQFQIENGAPYAFARDNGGDYYPMHYVLGEVHNIGATPYTQANAQGTAGSSASIVITFVDNSPVVTDEPVVTEEPVVTQAPEASAEPESTTEASGE